MCGSGRHQALRSPHRVQRRTREIDNSGVCMSSPWLAANASGSTLTSWAQISQRSHRRLPRPFTIERWARFQASSFGVGCQRIARKSTTAGAEMQPLRLGRGTPADTRTWAMASHCARCNPRNVVSYSAPRRSGASCFDELAEQGGIRYSFEDVSAMSWLDMPAPKARPGGSGDPRL